MLFLNFLEYLCYCQDLKSETLKLTCCCHLEQVYKCTYLYQSCYATMVWFLRTGTILLVLSLSLCKTYQTYEPIKCINNQHFIMYFLFIFLPTLVSASSPAIFRVMFLMQEYKYTYMCHIRSIILKIYNFG